MCQWRRINNLPILLQSLKNQTFKDFRLCIWNNNINNSDSLNTILKEGCENLDIKLVHSEKNVGGIGRFVLAHDEVLNSSAEKIFFIDDDQFITDNNFLQKISDYWEPRSIKSRWSFEITGKYWEKNRKHNGAVDYCGTGGMILDGAIFSNEKLFEVPEKYQFIEDLWLSYFSKFEEGYKLEAIPECLSVLVDDNDQYHSLINLKEEFLAHLRDRYHTFSSTEPPSVNENTNLDKLSSEEADKFIAYFDLASAALCNQNENIDGYGSGAPAAYKLLSEAQKLAPGNQAVATEIIKLQNIIETETTTNNDNITLTKSYRANETQHLRAMPFIEVFTYVSQQQLALLADTIDSLSSQTYSHWKLTVASNIPSPDPIFSHYENLVWIQNNNPQHALNHAVNSSNADWFGLFDAGGRFDNDAMLEIAKHDNAKGEDWQIIYSDEDHVNNNTYTKPIFKPDFDINQFKHKDMIGGFCFTRKKLLQRIGGINFNVENSNTDLVFRAINMVNQSTIGHIASILYHCPLHHTNQENKFIETQSSVKNPHHNNAKISIG